MQAQTTSSKELHKFKTLFYFKGFWNQRSSVPPQRPVVVVVCADWVAGYHLNSRRRPRALNLRPSYRRAAVAGCYLTRETKICQNSSNYAKFKQKTRPSKLWESSLGKIHIRKIFTLKNIHPKNIHPNNIHPRKNIYPWKRFSPEKHSALKKNIHPKKYSP